MKHFLIFPSQEARRIFNHIEASLKKQSAKTEHTGICASPGRVSGKVRIVASPAQNNKVKSGDILVTYATTVDYLPAMKKAAAFITEAGGLTCHAAVVAREFGVPCIVSLPGAMKKFKDGQLIEVNASEGTVKVVAK
jgi:pyruvate,water dikinase